MTAPFRFRWSAGLLVTLMLSGFGVLWERQSRVEADLSRRNESQAALAAELAAIRRELERLREENSAVHAAIQAALERLGRERGASRP